MSFLSDYFFYNSGNEASESYHHWAGLSALSSIISRRVWIDLGYFRVYPNLYIILVGPPGNKKTTAMAMAKGLIRELGTIPFSAECQTKESFVKELIDYQQTFQFKNVDKPYIYTPCSILVTEFSQFIGVDPARMIDFLTTVYDQDYYDLKTKNKGSQFIIGPYITILACTTPEWITSYLRTDVITGGFSRRANFVLEHDELDNLQRRIAFPKITKEMFEARDRLIKYSHLLFTVGGEFVWEDKAKQEYERWYNTRAISKNLLIRWYDSTAYIQILKVAMLMSLSESPELVMRSEYFEAAKALIEVLKVKLPQVFQGIGRNELNVVRMKVISTLQCTGPILEKKLLAIVFSELPNGGRDFVNLIADMEKTEDIVRGRHPTQQELIYIGLNNEDHRKKMGL